jgi:hypothetical protein
MFRAHLHARLWIAILSIAILAMPMGGAHLHLCFDGNEPAASVHAGDDGAHHDGTAAAIHHDLDVQLAQTALGKKISDSSDGMAFIAAAFVVFGSPPAGSSVVPHGRADARIPVSAVRLLPPSRGPPV